MCYTESFPTERLLVRSSRGSGSTVSPIQRSDGGAEAPTAASVRVRLFLCRDRHQTQGPQRPLQQGVAPPPDVQSRQQLVVVIVHEHTHTHTHTYKHAQTPSSSLRSCEGSRSKEGGGLPVHHGASVQGHEENLTAASRTNRGKENFVVPLRQELQALSSLVHENSIEEIGRAHV